MIYIEDVKIEEHATISSTLVRLANRLGIDRRVSRIVPDLGDYLVEKAQVSAAQEPEQECES